MVAYDLNTSIPHHQTLQSYLNAYDDTGSITGYSLLSTPTHGALSVDANGAFTYTPHTGFAGVDTFDFSATGPSGDDAATVTIQVTNQAPQAYPTHTTVLHDRFVAVYLGGHDPDGDPVTQAITRGPSHGTLSIDPYGSFTYTPNSGFAGADSFTYGVSDGIVTTTATIDISVYNTAPTAYGNSTSVLHGRTLSSYVSGYDPDGDPLHYSLASDPSHGVLALDSNGAFTYTPTAYYVGPDSFTFSVSDGVNTATAAVDINVYNNAPEAYEGTYYIHFNQGQWIYLSAYDPDGDELSYTTTQPPIHGELTPDGNGEYYYSPHGNHVGEDTFTFTVSDGVSESQSHIAIQLTNTAPVAYDAAATTRHDQSYSSTLSAYDADGDALTYELFTEPHGGAVTLAANGSFTYTPELNFRGMVSFEYLVHDGYDNDLGVVVITVESDAPIAHDGEATSHAGEPVTGQLSATSPDGSPLQFTVLTPVTHGSLTWAANGWFEYTPHTGFAGVESFEFEAANAHGADQGVFVVNTRSLALPTVGVRLKSSVAGYETSYWGIGAAPTTLHPGSIEGEDVEFEIILRLPEGVAELPMAVEVTYRTRDGQNKHALFNAKTGDDFEEKSGSVTFGVGTTDGDTRTIAVTTYVGGVLVGGVFIPNGDIEVEPDEEFLFELTSAVGASISPQRRAATGYIRNDDVELETKSVFKVLEGASVPIELTGRGVGSARRNGLAVYVHLSTSDDSARVVDDDYEPIALFKFPDPKWIRYNVYKDGKSNVADVRVFRDKTAEAEERFNVDFLVPIDPALAHVLFKSITGEKRNNDWMIVAIEENAT